MLYCLYFWFRYIATYLCQCYTSDIVNVGIQQAGVDDKIPEAISEEEMEKVLLFVQADDRQTVLDAYEKDENTYNQTVYVLKKNIQDNEEENRKN